MTTKCEVADYEYLYTERLRENETVTVKPMYKKYLESCKKKADIIIPANKDNNDGFDVVINKVRNIINNEE